MLTALAILKTIWSTLRLLGFFIYDHWKVTVPVILIALVVGYLLITGSCGRKPAKLNEAEIQTAIKGIEEKNDAKVKEVFVNAAVREAKVNSDLANADAAAEKARVEAGKKYENMNSDQLAAEIEKMR